jgi:ribosomal protein S20
VELEKALSALSIKDRKNKKEIEEKLELCRTELSREHFQYGLNLIESGEALESLDEFNKAIILSVEAEDRKKIQKKIEDVEKIIKKEEVNEKIQKNLENGKIFFERKEYAEAFVEYKEAYESVVNLSFMKDIKIEIETKLKEIEHSLAGGYIRKAEKFIENNKYDEAFQELECAGSILDSFAKEDISELDRLYKKVRSKVIEGKLKEEDFNDRILEKAIERYEDATDLYYRFGFSEDNPFNPKYQNKYESLYFEARKDLATVYEKIADKYMEQDKVAIAFKFYTDAISLLDEKDNVWNEVSGKIEIIQKLKRS